MWIRGNTGEVGIQMKMSIHKMVNSNNNNNNMRVMTINSRVVTNNSNNKVE